MFLLKSKFLDQEGGAPVLMKNNRYLESNRLSVFERINDWPEILNIPSCNNCEHEKYIKSNIPPTIKLKKIEKPDRIILRDAERTFLVDEHRQILITLLTILSKELGDYQQTMSYVTGILLLFFDTKIVFEMMMVLGQSPKYALSGYWKHFALGQAIDGGAVWILLKSFKPKLHEHLEKNNILPETIFPKLFGGLCVQVLPLNFLILFWNEFFKLGFRYLYKFALSLFEVLELSLLSCNNPSDIYKILALDPLGNYIDKDKLSPYKFSNNSNDNNFHHKMTKHEMNQELINHIATKILSSANAIGNKFQNINNLDFQKCREESYHNILCNRLIRASCSVSYESYLENDNNDDDDDDEVQDCDICNDGFGELYCDECDMNLCDNCNKEHTLSHSIKKIDLKPKKK